MLTRPTVHGAALLVFVACLLLPGAARTTGEAPAHAHASSFIPGANAADPQGPIGSHAWRLATDDTEIVVEIDHGVPSLRALAPTATHRNWIVGPAGPSSMKDVEVNGAAVTLEWEYDSAAYDPAANQLTLLYRNAHPSLELHSVWRARPGRGPVEHWATLTNRESHPITVTAQDSLALGGLEISPTEPVSIWWINRGGSNASAEGGVFSVRADPELDQMIVSDPMDPSSPVPWMAVQVGESGGLYVGWEFSGVGRIRAQSKGAKPLTLSLRVGNLPEFKTDVEAGETFLVPVAFVGCYTGDLDNGGDSLHHFILEKLMPPRPPGPYPTLAYNLYLDVGGNKATESDVLTSARLCNSLGFETFVTDAMWFAKDGDWRWDPARFPHGEEPIEQAVHPNGMKLGLWMAWTHASDSEDPGALNAFRHPDWFNHSILPDWKPGEINWDVFLDLGYAPARQWAEQAVERAVTAYKLDYLKHDYSPIATSCPQTNHRHHYGVDVSYWSALGYYELMEALAKKHPGLALEGCSGGGRIKDFGEAKHVHYMVATDTLSALPDRQSIYDSTYAFPPAMLMAYTYENYYNHTSDRPQPYLWRSAMMSAWQIDPTSSAAWTADERVGAIRSVQIYKRWIRPILADAEVHHILPRPDGLHWDGMFYWSPSLKKGTVYIFRPNNDEPTRRVRLRNLGVDVSYRVWSEDGSVATSTHSGGELMNEGLLIKLPGKYSSDLIYVEER